MPIYTSGSPIPLNKTSAYTVTVGDNGAIFSNVGATARGDWYILSDFGAGWVVV